jgi:hypothetical protein
MIAVVSEKQSNELQKKRVERCLLGMIHEECQVGTVPTGDSQKKLRECYSAVIAILRK